MTRGAQPEYPEVAREQGVTGTSVLRIQLSATGSIVSTSVSQSAGNAALDAAARRAARASSFAARIRNCRPVAGSYLFSATFN